MVVVRTDATKPPLHAARAPKPTSTLSFVISPVCQDDGGPGSEFIICALGTDEPDCGRGGRRLAVLQQALARDAHGRQLQSTTLCVDADDADISMSDVTFGADGVDPSGGAMVAFFLAVIAGILDLLGTVFSFQGKFKRVTTVMGFALIGNVCYWIYLIPYDAADNIEIRPGYSWGAGLNCGAFINTVAALGFSTMAGKAAVAPTA